MRRAPEPVFTDTLELDMSTIEPSLAGPKRPQDRVLLSEVDDQFNAELESTYKKHNDPRVAVEGEDFDFGNGDVVIAAITSCTNTSNPSVLIAAGLVARKAREKGLTSKPWVKTSLAPGSQVVTDYLNESGLSEDLERARLRPRRLRLHDLHRQFGPAGRADQQGDQRQGSGRGQRAVGQPQFRRPRVARLPRQLSRIAAAGGRLCAQGHRPVRHGQRADRHRARNGEPVFLKDIWPTNEEVRALIDAHVHSEMFRRRYADVYHGDERWRAIEVTGGETYAWPAESTYIQNPPYFTGMTMTPTPPGDIDGARPLAVFGDSITTDHISPAGAIKPDSPAGRYLLEHGVAAASSTATARAAAITK